MRLRILISLSLLLIAWQKAVAQLAPADDFFHGGALSYLSNNIPGALDIVTNALKFYPHDAKLKKLEELLKQQNQQQQQQNNQSKDDQKNEKKDQQQKSQDQKSDQEKKQQQQKESQEKKDQKQAEQQQAKKSEEKDKQKSEDEQQAQAYAAGQMTPQEAKQLLDSQKNDEMLMPVSRKDKARDQQKPIKDW